MEIIIHQAICGEQNKAWDLIKTTLPDNIIAKKVAFQADLQDSPPSGITWQPVIRGFLVNDYYLMMKTYPDTSPEVRNGRVFSHCLIIEKKALPLINDLSKLLRYFRNEIDKTISLRPIKFTPKNNGNILLEDSIQLRFNKAIKLLVSFTNDLGVIVWVGQEHFDLVICKFWQLLSPDQRVNFNFGINFNPSEVLKDKLNFIAIPDNIVNKFENRGFNIIHKEDSVLLTEFPEQYLAGEKSAIDRIKSFTVAVEADNLSIKDISIIAKGIRTYENIDKVTDIKLLITLSNIITKYSPNTRKGIIIKSKLIERISELTETADPSDVFLLRNFELSSFQKSEIQLSSSLVIWCSNYLLSEVKNSKYNFVPFLLQILDHSQSNWLICLIKEKLTAFLSKINFKSARIIWIWIKNDFNILKRIAGYIDDSKDAEIHFCKSFQKLGNKGLTDARIFSLERGWLNLFATIVKSQYSFEKALSELLRVDTESTHVYAINLLTMGVNSRKVIAFSIVNGDSRLVSLAGRICKNEPYLLDEIRLENENWQKVWLAAINNGNKITDGFTEPKKIINKVFDLLIKSHTINESLLEKISISEYANVLDYPQRSKIWSKLPGRVKNNFLEKTSAALLEILSNNSTYQVPSDKELSEYIIKNAISTFLYFNRKSIKSCLPIFTTYAQLPENILNDYISNYSGNLDVVDATQLGQLVNKKGYNSVAYTIYYKAYSNKQFKIALVECYDLLDILTRGIAWGTGIISKIDFSKDEWWDAFTELSYKLYSGGPTENKVWIEADGKEYDLQTQGTGKEVWISALKLLSQGGCTGITTKKLLKVMQRDFPENDELKTLKNLSKKL